MPSSGRTDLNIRPVSELQRSEIEMIKVRLYDLEVKEGAIAVADGSITNAKLADMNQATVKGRAWDTGTGVPIDLTPTQLQEIIGSQDFQMAPGTRINTAGIWGLGTEALEIVDGDGTLGLIVHYGGKIAVNIPGTQPSATQGTGRMQIFAESGAQLVLHQTAVSAGGPILEFLKRRSGFDVITAGDIVGEVLFSAADSVDAALAAQIKVTVDGTPGSNDMPGRITFLTSADGGATPAESFHINSLQNLIMADAKRIETDEVRARDSGGLMLTNDAGEGGIFIRDSGFVIVGEDQTPATTFEVRSTTGGLTLSRTTDTAAAEPFIHFRFGSTPAGVGQMRGISTGGIRWTDTTSVTEWMRVGSTGLIIANGLRIESDEVRARDSGGLYLRDDSGNLGVFVEDGGFVGINKTDPVSPLHVERTAVSGAEEIARFTVSDDATAYLRIVNSTGGDGAFVPSIDTLSDSTVASRIDLCKITTDTGTVPAFIIDARTNAGAAITTRPIVDYRTFGTSRMIILGSGQVGIGNTTPDAKLDVVQSSTTANIPTLELQQADLSEEFINFVATQATGNPIEAVGAKTLTTTHFVRVRINGAATDYYLPVGTIA